RDRELAGCLDRGRDRELERVIENIGRDRQRVAVGSETHGGKPGDLRLRDATIDKGARQRERAGELARVDGDLHCGTSIVSTSRWQPAQIKRKAVTPPVP